MSQVIVINGTNYTIPTQGDSPPWGPRLSSAVAAIASAIGTGGTFSYVSINTTPVSVVSGSTYAVDTSVGAITFNLGAPASNAFFMVKDIGNQAATNNITIHRFGSETINGVAADKLLKISGGFWIFLSDGTNWIMLRDPDTGDIVNPTAGSGLVLKTPDGLQNWRIALDNSGNITTEQVL